MSVHSVYYCSRQVWTEIYPTVTPPKPLAMWIIIVSIVGGVLLLIIIGIVLWKVYTHSQILLTSISHILTHARSHTYSLYKTYTPHSPPHTHTHRMSIYLYNYFCIK
jgi:uncharacterized membrane protein